MGEEGDPTTILLILPREKGTFLGGKTEITLAVFLPSVFQNETLNGAEQYVYFASIIPLLSTLQTIFLNYSIKDYTQHLGNLRVYKGDRNLCENEELCVQLLYLL